MRSRASLSASSASALHYAAAASISAAPTRKAHFAEIDMVEFRRKLDERRVAARAHVGNDAAHRLLDVLRRLAFRRQKGGKTRGKIGTFAVQTQRHVRSCRARRGLTGQWVMCGVASSSRTAASTWPSFFIPIDVKE